MAKTEQGDGDLLHQIQNTEGYQPPRSGSGRPLRVLIIRQESEVRYCRLITGGPGIQKQNAVHEIGGARTMRNP